MNVYCRACGTNHNYAAFDLERLVYALEASVADGVFERWTVVRGPAGSALVLCLNDVLATTRGEGAYAEFADLMVALRHQSARKAIEGGREHLRGSRLDRRA